MEKVLYVLRRPPELATDRFAARLLGEVGPGLGQRGAVGVQVNVVDHHVEPGAGLRFTTDPQPPDAVVSAWMPSAVAGQRRPFDDMVGPAEAYLVTESQAIVDATTPGPDGRTPGFAQLAFLRRPERLTPTEWLDRWLDHHTAVAVRTQSTFAYTQHVVVRRLDAGPGRGYDAVVEECFPGAAMTDQHAFYDADGDDERLERNRTELLESVGRILDLDHIDVVPTSRYAVGAATTPGPAAPAPSAAPSVPPPAP